MSENVFIKKCAISRIMVQAGRGLTCFINVMMDMFVIIGQDQANCSPHIDCLYALYAKLSEGIDLS